MASKKKKVIHCPDCGMAIVCRNCFPDKKQKVVKTAASNYATTKKGVRSEVHTVYCFKSATEANVARLLTYLQCDWRYEERAFTFDGYKTRPHVYIMDFEIFSSDNTDFPPGYYEVKGFMNAASRQKLRRLKMRYPVEADRTIVILYNHTRKADISFCEKLGFKYLFYDLLAKQYRDYIPGWE